MWPFALRMCKRTLAIGLFLVRRFALNGSWRSMLLTTTVFLNLVDMGTNFQIVAFLCKGPGNPSSRAWKSLPP